MFGEPLVAHRAETRASPAPRDAHRHGAGQNDNRRENAKQGHHRTALVVLKIKMTDRGALAAAGAVVKRRTPFARRGIVFRARHAGWHLRSDADLHGRLLAGDMRVPPRRGFADGTAMTRPPDAGGLHDRLTVWMTWESVCSLLLRSRRMMRRDPRVTLTRTV